VLGRKVRHGPIGVTFPTLRSRPDGPMQSAAPQNDPHRTTDGARPRRAGRVLCRRQQCDQSLARGTASRWALLHVDCTLIAQNGRGDWARRTVPGPPENPGWHYQPRSFKVGRSTFRMADFPPPLTEGIRADPLHSVSSGRASYRASFYPERSRRRDAHGRRNPRSSPWPKNRLDHASTPAGGPTDGQTQPSPRGAHRTGNPGSAGLPQHPRSPTSAAVTADWRRTRAPQFLPPADRPRKTRRSAVPRGDPRRAT